MVSSMSSAGVYAVLDMHQDVLWASSYWGVPPWIKAKLPPPSYPFPYPFEEISKWFCGYFAVEVDEGYQVSSYAWSICTAGARSLRTATRDTVMKREHFSMSYNYTQHGNV